MGELKFFFSPRTSTRTGPLRSYFARNRSSCPAVSQIAVRTFGRPGGKSDFKNPAILTVVSSVTAICRSGFVYANSPLRDSASTQRRHAQCLIDDAQYRSVRAKQCTQLFRRRHLY